MGVSHPLRVVYILLYFPRLTETFIADEVWSLASHNVDVRIVSLLSPSAELVQPRSRDLLRQTSYAPAVLTWATWRAQTYFLRKSFRVYLSLLTTLLREPYVKQPVRSLFKRLVVFLKAVSVAHMLHDSEIDLIHSHFAWLPGAAAWICARLLGKPFSVTVHAYDIYSQKNDLLRLVSREADHVIAVSQFNQSRVAALGPGLADRISVIHCGIEVGKLSARHTTGLERPEEGPIRILSVGSLVAKKGHRNLVAACHLLDQRGLSFTCTIIGGGPEEHALREQISTHGLQDRVELRGARPHPEIIQAHSYHDVFVLACVVAPDGDRDGIPVVLMEAGNAGLAIVSTPVSGIPELVRHLETGWLVQPDDPAALADAIAALAGDADGRRQMGRNAHALVQSEFDVQESTRQLAEVFRGLSVSKANARL
jgi:colanic acid/amylovoran biosynthesis glycosyltransferase